MDKPKVKVPFSSECWTGLKKTQPVLKPKHAKIKSKTKKS